MVHQTHFFFAVKIPEETKLVMKEHCEKLKQKLPFSRWVHHEDLHITLAFLGNAPSDKLTLASNNVLEALLQSSAFPLQINNLGTFGSVDSPRIFWADLEKSKELQSIRERVFTACEQAGFQLESRPFRPHITLARKWAGDDKFQKDFLQLWSELQSEPLTFKASEVVLYQTHLQNTPKYEEKVVYIL